MLFIFNLIKKAFNCFFKLKSEKMRKTPNIAISHITSGLALEWSWTYLILLYNYIFFYIYTTTHLLTPSPTHALSYYTPRFLQKIKQIPFDPTSCHRIKTLKGSTMRALALFAFICFLCCIYLMSLPFLRMVKICTTSSRLDQEIWIKSIDLVKKITT